MGVNLIKGTNQKYEPTSNVNENAFAFWMIQNIADVKPVLTSEWWNGSWAVKATIPDGATGYSYFMIKASYFIENLIPDTTYTLSFDVNLGGWVTFVDIMQGNARYSLLASKTTQTNKTKSDGTVHCSVTFKTRPASHENWANKGGCGLYFIANRSPNTYYINNLKLEFGEVDTSYTPSPLDIPTIPLDEDMFEQGSISQNSNGIYESIKTQSGFTHQLRTKELIPCTGEKLAIHVSSGYEYYLCFFSGQNNLKIHHSWTGHDKWIDIPKDADHFALLFKRYPESTSALAPSEIAQICGGGVDVMATKATASITLAKVDDGVDAFTIVYDSPNGLEFSDSVKSIAITAKVFKGGKELTDAEVNKFGAIKWYQVGVAAAIATGKTLTLTAPKEVYATLEN